MRLGREVAIKILPPHFSADTVRKQRFEREAKTISHLNHPHICTLYDVGSQNGIEYLVMECVEGDTLEKRLQRGALPLEQVLRYGAQIADALDKAHRSGIVHRDLKPGNIMIAATGAKLLDFGLARPTEQSLSLATLTATAPAHSHVTQEGTIVGTFQYMSPEQVEGNDVDGRSDIFSLGAVLYEMITGQRAFDGKSQLSVASAILEREPATITTLKPLTPSSLEHAISRCLRKNPADRWQSARDLTFELTWIVGTSDKAVAPSTDPIRLKRLVWAQAFVSLALLIGLIGMQFRTTGNSQHRRLRLSLLPPVGTSFSPRNLAISPDGQRLAFVAEGGASGSRLWIRSLAASTAQELNNTDGATYPFWSADNKQIGFFADGKLKNIDPSGGVVQTVCDAFPLFGATWNHRGIIVFPSPDGALFEVSASGGTPKPVTQANNGEVHRWPIFLPDGDHFLYYVFSWQGWLEGRPGGIYVGSLSSTERKLVSADIVNDIQFGAGKLFFVRDRSLVAQPFDVKRLQLTGAPESIASQELELSLAFSQAGFSVSGNGTVVFQSTSDNYSRFTWFDRKGKEMEIIPASGFRDPNVARDGTLLAATSDDQLNGKFNIRVYDFLRNVSIQVTASGSDEIPLLSPDKKTVAFDRGVTTSGAGRGHIFLVPIDGSGKPALLVKGSVMPNDWSRDGRYLLYMDFRDGSGYPRLGYYDFQSRSENPYAFGAEGQISPDSKWIAYTAPAGNEANPDYKASDVYVGPFPKPGARLQISNHGGAQPRWSPDGKELYYITLDKKLMAVPVSNEGGKFVAGIPQLLFQTRIIASRITLIQYAVGPDGNRFLINSLPPVGAVPLTVLSD
jgi:serine/threonine protein kinase